MIISTALEPARRFNKTRLCFSFFALMCLIFVGQPVNAQVSPQVLGNHKVSYARTKTLAMRTGFERSQWNGTRPASGGQFRNGLPPTQLDSFVLNAGRHAENIYGDESLSGPPPYECFTKTHRINTGITGDRDSGLTTGHGSQLPDAWGRDEFSGSPEFSQSGARGYEHIAPAFKTPAKSPDVEFLPESQQFQTGTQELNRMNYYDETRVRPATDPYYHYMLSPVTIPQPISNLSLPGSGF